MGKMGIRKYGGLLHCRIVVFIVAVSVYANTLRGDYLHDDIPAILRNNDVQGKSQWTGLWKNDFWGTPMSSNASHKSYRPVTVILFKLEHLLFGNSAVCAHCINVLLNGMVCVLLFNMLTRVVFIDLHKSVCAALLFATHPIHTEVVANLVGRAELLSCLFYLFALGRFASKTTQATKHGFILNAFSRQILPALEALIIVAIGTMSKENCLTAIGILTVFEIIRLRQRHTEVNYSDVLIRLSILWAGLAVVMHERLRLMDWKLPKFAEADNPASTHPSQKVRVLTYSYIVFVNFRLLVLPDTLCYDWSYSTIPLVRSYYDTRNIYTLLFAIFLMILILRSLQQFASNTNADVIYGAVLMIVPFMPASNLFFPVGFVVAERTLYLPSIGFVVVQVKLFSYLWGSRTKWIKISGWIFFSSLIILYTRKTWNRNIDWENKQNLFQSGVKTFPHNAKVRYNWANYLRDNDKKYEAIAEYETALELHPSYTGALNNLALLVESDNVLKAEELYVRLIRIQPLHEQAYRNLANLLIKQKEYDSAINVLSKLLKLKNDNTEYALELAEFLFANNRTDKSRKVFEKLATKICDVKEDFFKAANILCNNKHANIDQGNSMCISNKTQVCHVILGCAITQPRKPSKLQLQFLEMCAQIVSADTLVNIDTAVFILQHSTDKTSGNIAFNVLTKSLEINQENRQIIWEKGVDCLQRNQLFCAEKVFEILFKKFADNVNVASQYGTVLFTIGDTSKGMEILQSVVENDVDCVYLNAHRNFAAMLAKISKHNMAIKILTYCVENSQNTEQKTELENDIEKYKESIN